MPLKIKGLTSGSVVIKAPDTGADDVEYDIANDFATPTSVTAVDTRVNAVGGRKNLIINGGFDVWQRGTSFIDPSHGYGSYTADRWATYYNLTLTEKQTNTVDGSLMNTLKCSGNNGSRPYIYHKIEQGSKLISGKEVTVSFWYKSTATMTLQYRYGTSTGSTSGSSADMPVDTSIASTSSWVKYTKTFTPVDPCRRYINP